MAFKFMGQVLESCVFVVLSWNLEFREMRPNGIKPKQNKAAVQRSGGYQFLAMTYVLAAAGPRGLIYKIAILQEGGKRSSCKKTKPKTTGLFQKLKFLNLC